jgi:hypothetical protein
MPCACVYIRALPTASASHIEGLNCDLLYYNLVPLLPLERLVSVPLPRGRIPSFPAVEPVTELVTRVWVFRSHSAMVLCDVSCNLLPSPNQAVVLARGVRHHLLCIV